MGMSCQPAPTNKKEYISNIGKILVEDNGKKKYYSPEEVKKAYKKSKWKESGVDFSCWVMSVFTSHYDFDKYHEQTGEVCDYIEMKTEMLKGLSVSSAGDWTGISDIEVDASWLDFGDIFGDVFEGIGEFIGEIFDGLS